MAEHGHPSSFLHGDTSADGNMMHRSMTRGSHNSHASASASTRSWVMSNQINPPPPQLQRSSSGLTPFHGPRPLPESQSVRLTPVRYPAPAIENEEGEGEQPVGPSSIGMQYCQQPEVLTEAEGGDNYSSPTSTGNVQDSSKRGDRSLIGGLISGLRRLPTVFKIGGGGQKSKKRIARQGTLGTEGTSSPATGITRGNTLPRYLSNPSIRPSNPQFAHRLSIAVANGALPPDASPSAFQARPHPQPNSSMGSLQRSGNPSPPHLVNHSLERHPSPLRPNIPTIIRVTPPSAEADTEERTSDLYGEPAAIHQPFESLAPSNPNDNNDTRATVMVYNSDDSHEPYPTTTPPAQRVNGPRVSYVSQPTSRASGRIQDEPPPLPTVPFASPPLSPLRGVSSAERPKDVLSPHTTSRYTRTTMASYYDPSFALHLTPVEKFFKGLYNLPWIARERVTIDYRPGDSNRAKAKVKGGVRRPMASWYRDVVSRSRRFSRDLDLLGNGTGSASASTSLGNSLTPRGSPTSRRSGCSSNHNQYHRHRKTRRRGTTLTDPPQRNVSSSLPAVYPYQYPPYPFTYPYGSYPAASIPLPVSQTAPPPRGHRVPKYPHGYTPYQPMPQPPPQPPPPVYFIAPSPPPNHEGQAMHVIGQPVGATQIPPVVMQYVPSALNQNTTLASPPITPQRTTVPQSQ